MGQAKGTFEERKARAIQRELDKEEAEYALKWVLYKREQDAWNTMVWWQMDMSEERHSRIMKAKFKSQLAWASLYGMIHGMGWDSFSHMYR